MTDNAIIPMQPADLDTADAADKILAFLGELNNALANTYDIAEVMQIKDRADAIRFLTNKLDVDQSVKNRATESQIRTNVRLGQLLAEMPKNSGVRLGGNTLLPPGNEPTYADLGIDKMQASRAQTLAKLPPEKLDKFIQEAMEDDHELTQGGALAYAKNVLKLGPMMSSNSPEWYTTRDIIDAVIAVMGGIDLDPCSNSHDSPNVPADHHFTKEDDGLKQQWFGRVYMNPPYGSEIPHWADKLVLEFLEGRVTQAIVLLPSRTDTQWFRSLKDFPRCFMWGRVKFNDNPNSAPFPTMLVSVGCDRDRFIKVMSALGDIYERIES
jgi:hypothetical protein